MSKKSDVACATAPMTKPSGFDDYQIKSAAEDIQRAHEHLNNPKLMKHVRKHLVTKKKAVDSMMAMLPEEDGDESGSAPSVKGLRQKYNEKFGSK